MDGTDRRMLIAETDAEGRVVWVWMSASGTGRPRPVEPGQPCAAPPHGLEIVGAERAAVLAWLEARGCAPRPVQASVLP